ncbi:MAG TPA: glycosyltransferase family protein [Nitrososphaerales archaeon]|nr:glycosyltransferase family protein [Nitrososphaerales archaeon]
MPKILYGVSPIGLGHTTRSLVVRDYLVSMGAEVRMFSGGKAADFMRKRGVVVEDIVSDPVPRVKQGEMKRASLWYLRSWVGLRRTVPRTVRLFEGYLPDVVVCDEEFSGYVVSQRRGTPCAFIADELELGFAKGRVARNLEGRVEGWYKSLQRTVDLLIVPEEGVDEGNLRRIGPIVRPVTKSSSEARASYSLPSGPMILFSMSGSGIGNDLLLQTIRAFQKASIPGSILVVSGNRGKKATGTGIYDLRIVEDNQNLISAADLVISSAGKSTIDEARASGTPLIAIPIAHHAEQERNAAALGYVPSDSKRLAELIESKIGRREAPRQYKGGEEASRLIFSLFR